VVGFEVTSLRLSSARRLLLIWHCITKRALLLQSTSLYEQQNLLVGCTGVRTMAFVSLGVTRPLLSNFGVSDDDLVLSSAVQNFRSAQNT
jgi:hypothetical protein